jgi:alpha-glucosidase
MAAAFALYEAVGVRQVKTGYVADAGDIRRIDENGVEVHEWHDGQYTVGHHLRVLREAAKHKISINAHEPVKDTGLRRTYPNWLAREGARGQEYNAWGTPPNPPEHTAILPYTRMLSGPMDYTPGVLELMPNGADSVNRVESTIAKELSLYVVLYSPIQMAADLPENYVKHAQAFQFIKDVPTDWDESVGLAGEVGDYVAIARKQRGSPDWFLGALTDENPRRLTLRLDFLDPKARYVAEIYRDGPEADWKQRPYDLVVETRNVTAADTLELALASSGGAAIRFKSR